MIGILLIALPATAAADGVIRDGVGAITTGRGGTNLGFNDNGELLLDNPAGIVGIQGTQLVEIGADLLFTNLTYSDADNPTTRAIQNPMPMGQISLIRKSPDGLWAVGLGMFSQAGFQAEYEMQGPVPMTGTQHYKSFGSLSRILPGVGLQLTDTLRAGGTLGVAVSHFELEGPYFLQGPHPFAGLPTMLDFQGTGAGLSWSAGLQYDMSPTRTVGFSYVGQTDMSLAGNTRVNSPGLGSARFESELDISWPSILGVGIHERLSPDSSLAVDLLWFNWSSAFDQFDLHLSDADNPMIAALTGPSITDRYPLDWRDTLSVRVGFERHLCMHRTIRAGYVYHRSPIPAETLTPFIQATLEHAFAAGYRYCFNGYWVDLAYQFSFGSPQSWGDSAFLGGDFADGNVETQAHWISVSLTRQQ
jgi:long-subunit fatty acid transport protein